MASHKCKGYRFNCGLLCFEEVRQVAVSAGRQTTVQRHTYGVVGSLVIVLLQIFPDSHREK